MPRANVSYFYEFKICAIANDIAAQVINDFDPEAANCFVILFKNDFKSPELEFLNADSSFKYVDELIENGQSFIFLDNFDPHMYTFLRWNRITQTQMETLQKEKFMDKDFIHFKTKEKDPFRESGSVMLG